MDLMSDPRILSAVGAVLGALALLAFGRTWVLMRRVQKRKALRQQSKQIVVIAHGENPMAVQELLYLDPETAIKEHALNVSDVTGIRAVLAVLGPDTVAQDLADWLETDDQYFVTTCKVEKTEVPTDG